MLDVLKFTAQPIEKDTFDQLEEMGFDSGFIQKAICQSKDRSISGLLNWLIANEGKSKAHSKPTSAKNIEDSEAKPKKKGKNSQKNQSSLDDVASIQAIIEEMSGPSNVISRQGSNKKKKSSNNEEFKSQQKIISPQVCPVRPEKLSSSATNEVKKLINSIEDGNSNQPSDIIKCLNDILKKWKYTKSDTDSEILFALCGDELRDELLVSLRNKLYQLIDKLFSMKIKREAVIDIPAIETVLMNSHDLGIFSKYQVEKLKISYIKFCKKLKATENEALITQLESKSKSIGLRGVAKFKLGSPEAMPESGDLAAGEKISKLTRLSDEENSDDRQAVMEAQADEEKELCVICMDRIREIVYLPCSHFITCPLCGPCLKECPLCAKKIDKQLKIYWC